jgi:hypothetical protein
MRVPTRPLSTQEQPHEDQAARDPSTDWLPWLTALVVAVCIAWPLVTCAWLPFVDYPEHLAAVAVIHRADAPEFAQYFKVNYRTSRYLLFYLGAHELSYVFGVEGGTRLMAALSLALLPLAMVSFLRAHGRSALWAPASGLVAIHVYVFWGFLNYSLGMTIGLFALAAHARLTSRPDWSRAVAYAGLALACFYAHAQAYVWLAAASLVQWLFVARMVGWRQARQALWRSIVASVPSVAGAVWWLRTSGVVETGEGLLRSGVMPENTRGVQFAPLVETLKGALDQSVRYYRDGTGERLFLVFAVIMGVGLAYRVSRHLRQEPPTAAAWMPGSLAPEAVLALSVLAWLFAPHTFDNIDPINDRFLPLSLILLPVLGPTRLSSGIPRRGIAAACMAAAVHMGYVHHMKFVQTDREMGALAEALAQTQSGHRLLGLIYDRESAIVPFVTYLHAHQYYQARVGGLAAWGFVELPMNPYVYRPGRAPAPFPPRWEWFPERFDWGTYGGYFDYYLVRTPPGGRAPVLAPPDTPLAPHVVFEGDRWTLLARPGL